MRTSEAVLGAAIVLAVILIVGVSCENQAQRAPSSQSIDWLDTSGRNEYMLDNGGGFVSLYPGFVYRGHVEEKYSVPSFEILKRRVALLPRGAKVLFSPYEREPNGQPILFANGQFAQFERFCKNRGIELIVGR